MPRKQPLPFGAIPGGGEKIHYTWNGSEGLAFRVHSDACKISFFDFLWIHHRVCEQLWKWRKIWHSFFKSLTQNVLFCIECQCYSHASLSQLPLVSSECPSGERSLHVLHSHFSFNLLQSAWSLQTSSWLTGHRKTKKEIKGRWQNLLPKVSPFQMFSLCHCPLPETFAVEGLGGRI